MLGMDNICQAISPLTMWRTMVVKAFIENDQSPYADAVRRGISALDGDNTVYRLTPEFEDLIKIEKHDG